MLETLKKIFTIQNPSIHKKDTIEDKLREMTSYLNISGLFLSPVNKLTLINVYTTTAEELLNNFYNEKFIRNTLCAVNLYSYFQTNKDIDKFTETVLKHSNKTKLSAAIEHDLYELYNVFLLLKNLESSNGK